MIKKSALVIEGRQIAELKDFAKQSRNRDDHGWRMRRLISEEIASVRPVKSKTAAPMLISMCVVVFQRQEDGVMRMGEIDIYDFEAAQKARSFEEKGETEEA